MWTVRQAESIVTVRGLPIRVRHCRPRGRAQRSGGDTPARYRNFECLAGARAINDPYPFETVAVLYELRPTDRYTGPRSRHRLANVRFVGGPGIP